MKKNIFFILVLPLLLMFITSSLNAGYSRDPWGSRTWTGPGRPPHWSPAPTSPKNKSKRRVHPNTPGKSIDSDFGVRPLGGSYGRGGYWRDKHNRWYFHKRRRSGYIYYRVPKVETVIIERVERIPAYAPARQKPSRVQCGGKTITRTDSKTGEMIIEYVTGAQDCP